MDILWTIKKVIKFLPNLLIVDDNLLQLKHLEIILKKIKINLIKAMQLWAFDYLRKPFRFIDIQVAIERTQKYPQILEVFDCC